MKSSAAARRYARALFSIASDADDVDSVRRELNDMSELLEASPELGNSMFRPLHPALERRALLQAVCERIGSTPTVRTFYSFLIDQRRLVDFPGIREEYGRLADEAAGRTVASVVTASPLSDDQHERMQRALSARTGLAVELQVDVDSTLIGGAIATVGGLVFDGSLRTQLQQLRAALTRGH
jgi:F-type H+-transporting ATPase subunit delta